MRAPAPRPDSSDTSDTHETAILTIDLAALADNYRDLCARARPAECAAVVKADAYGLGMAQAASALWRAGCRTFFVATIAEGIDLRTLLPDAVIYVLNGLMAGTAMTFQEHGLRPVLNSAAEVRDWAGYCARNRKALPCAVHLDTGMNRLGLSALDVDEIRDADELWEALALSLVMSHLACADDRAHAKNAQQRARFEALRALLPETLTSLANSAGILLGPDYHYDLVRPGVALYGGHPQRQGENPFRAVVHLMGRILQIRHATQGETVGYGATRTLQRPTRIAVVSAGYADGLFRALSAGDGETGLTAYLGPYAAPILGRVSMDLISVDVTEVPEAFCQRGAWVELLGPNVSAHTMAAQAGTIDYEVLTSLGTRATRRYIGG
ncbi:alanine racemase [Methyloceanibacter methanicus]|uniref:alanine racemase n=1 Tax=Methyloceanibacter methanicus TaxID=1774968 RepID=UPI000B04FDCF|nr:alanine racemase [Methyloceanibacter methanicus]